MRILGLIPARGGSKGVPFKNKKLLHGKELIRYSIETGLNCPLIDDVIVSTENVDIAKIAKNAGAKIPFLRPEELATDDSPSIDTIIHALEFLDKSGDHFDAICLLQPTVPFRNFDDVTEAILKFKESDADSLISVREVPHIYNPHWIYEENKETGFLKRTISSEKMISRRQDLPKAFHRDGSIYLTKVDVILSNKSLYGEKITYHEMVNSPNINIDTKKDWIDAELYLNSFSIDNIHG
ncbi:MAG: acylneuraminate cytidylyltransferase family protein [Saprospiraceae bacterium]